MSSRGQVLPGTVGNRSSPPGVQSVFGGIQIIEAELSVTCYGSRKQGNVFNSKVWGSFPEEMMFKLRLEGVSTR